MTTDENKYQLHPQPVWSVSEPVPWCSQWLFRALCTPLGWQTMASKENPHTSCNFAIVGTVSLLVMGSHQSFEFRNITLLHIPSLIFLIENQHC